MRIRNFAGNEDGAVTVDFVVLCASVVVLGVLVLNVVTDGTETAAAAIDDQIGSAMGGSEGGAVVGYWTPPITALANQTFPSELVINSTDLQGYKVGDPTYLQAAGETIYYTSQETIGSTTNYYDSADNILAVYTGGSDTSTPTYTFK